MHARYGCTLRLAMLWCCCCAFVGMMTLLPMTHAAIAYGYQGLMPEWQHRYDLSDDFRILWMQRGQDITFEIQARTLGYVGFGFSPDGTREGSDMAVAWISEGHTFFQDRHVKRNKLLVDPSQDYILLNGYENATHTVIRFQRKLDTCDSEHDIAITNDTMRLMYIYSESDPPHQSLTASSMTIEEDAWQPTRSLLLTQKPMHEIVVREYARKFDLRNQNVQLPYGDDTLIWCSMFKLEKFDKKHHIIRYAPIYDSSWSIHYMQKITLYECTPNGDLEKVAHRQGQQCMTDNNLRAHCNMVVAAWTRGSEKFSFPTQAGYPIEANEVKYYLMETMYSNLNFDPTEYQVKQLLDNSGLTLEITSNLRQYDAGILSIGIDSNWRHIIPPGQRHVISQGQCIEECTREAFPDEGINIFAAMMRTHRIGKEISLRQIRNGEELPPIIQDKNVDNSYQEFRSLSKPIVSKPGDRLVAECIYDSTMRDAITLGGLAMKEESCNALVLYYPRQKRLSTCLSLPSLPTLLHSLGIEQLATDLNPIVIAAPAELAGMTLEKRLVSYDWENHFHKFQHATLEGSFKPICLDAQSQMLRPTKDMLGYHMNITKSYSPLKSCKTKRKFLVTETVSQLELPIFHDIQSNHLNLNEGAAQRSSRSSTIETLALSGTKSSSDCLTIFYSHLTAYMLTLLVLMS